ncbi:MAG: response regulator [Parcubacteria group bacterium]|nr:response regulator [Parcubacteria group bacterium]
MPDVKKKILIVDDEQSIRELFTETLSHQGFECLTAGNGLEGLRAVVSGAPDIILLDLRMPEMDGLAMLKALRQKDKNMPVIILSTLNDEKSIAEALQYGVSDFFEKSNWNATELMERIREHIEHGAK